MFTDDQLKQLKKVIRGEVESEAEKTRRALLYMKLEVTNRLIEVEDSIKDVKISTRTLEKGQEELKAGLVELKAEQQSQSKTIKYIKQKLNKAVKTLDIVAIRYDERIVLESKRVDRVEDILKLPPLKN